MATYGTDLVLLATGSDGSGGTWGEFVGWDSGGIPASDAENFIQGAASRSQTFGNPVTGKSIAFDAGSDIASSIPSGDVVIGWVFIGAATNLYSYASGGWRFGIGASLTNFDMWSISGDDRPPNPYGGWWNVAVNPRVTPDYTGGSGSGGAWRYFGSVIGDTTLGIRAKIAKGNPHAVDGLLMGRGEIYCHGTGATFTLMSAQNDLVANRWGLLQDTGGGTFLWKGLMSFGITATAVTFSDSNKTIVIDDCPKTYTDFNKIEFNHADTDVTLTGVTFLAKGTFAPGNLEMVANCTLALSGCSFNNMGTFLFNTGATVTGTGFNGCGVITIGGATFDTCTFKSCSPIVVTDLDLLDACAFTSSGTGHGIDLGTISASDSMGWNCQDSGYATQVGTAADRTILVNVATSQTLTIVIADGASTPTYYNTGAGTVVISSDKTVTFTGIVNGSEVRVYKVSDDSVVGGVESVTGGQFAWSAASSTEVYYHIINPLYEQISVMSYTVTANTSLPFKQKLDRNYRNP